MVTSMFVVAELC